MATVIAKVTELTIEIPEIVVIPTQEVTFGFNDFDLTGLDAIAQSPISDEIMVQRLREKHAVTLPGGRRPSRRASGELPRTPPHGHARGRLRQPERTLFKLSGQMVRRLQTYLLSEDDIENVLLVHGKDLARFIFAQMKQHYWETPTDYHATVARGFQLLRPQAFNVPNANAVRNFRQPVVPAGDTKKHVFGGFQRCCYPYQRFHPMKSANSRSPSTALTRPTSSAG